MNVIIITGASSGLGREFALQMDNYFSNIDQFWLIGRNQKRLNEVAQALQFHAAMILDMDVTDEEALDELEQELKNRNAKVRMLINCAGYGIMGDFAHQDRNEVLGMIKVNCEALTDLTQRLIPYMSKGSRIIQLASSAAFLPQPDFAVYAATKSYVLSFSRALGEELRKREIYVTSVCPGPVNTHFFDVAEKDGTTLALKKMTMVEPDVVVAKALRDSYHKRELSVYSLPILAFEALTKWVPHTVILHGMRGLKALENHGSATQPKRPQTK